MDYLISARKPYVELIKKMNLPFVQFPRSSESSFENQRKLKGLETGLKELEIGERIETNQITGLLKSARILRRLLETGGKLLSLKIQ